MKTRQKFKKSWGALIVGWLMVSHPLSSVAQFNDTIHRKVDKIENVEKKTLTEILDNLNISIEEKYKEFKESSEWKKIIEYYWMKANLEKYIKELEKIDSQWNWESIVKQKINKIAKEIIEDMGRNPDKYWYFEIDLDSTGNTKFIIDMKKFNHIAWKKIEEEFKDFLWFYERIDNNKTNHKTSHLAIFLASMTWPILGILIILISTIIAEGKTKDK